MIKAFSLVNTLRSTCPFNKSLKAFYISISSYRLAMQNAPAADRNKDAILQVLQKYLTVDFSGKVLEIASGTGQHTAHFSQAFPNATWHPTDIDAASLKSIAAYKDAYSLGNVQYPVYVDVTTPAETWSNVSLPEASVDVIVNCNMIHISPWDTAIGLFRAARYLLKQGGLLFLYGPFAIDGELIPESNVNFDKSLRSRDSSWGIRDTSNLQRLANDNGIELLEMIDMPANNKTLVWKKQ